MIIRFWFWLKVVVEVLWVRVVEVVWVIIGVDLLILVNFCGCRKVGGVGGFRVGVGEGIKGNVVGIGVGVGLGESKVIVKIGRKGCGIFSGGLEGLKFVG